MNVYTTKRNTLNRNSTATGRYVELDGESCYRISNSQTMAPFFMSLVSPSDHWMFVASNGALTAGRRNSDNALFPYYSSDKLIDMVQAAGPKTIIRSLDDSGRNVVWEPFSQSNSLGTNPRSLYKNLTGSKLHFEETNPELDLVFRYSWESSDRFGFVRTCHLTNRGTEQRPVSIFDGLKNVLPYGVDEMFQLRFSNLVDAYKKCELVTGTALGVYYLSSIPTDHAEPSEGLRATVVWQTGLEHPTILLSDQQIEAFRGGREVRHESDLRGQRGSYFVNASFELLPEVSQSWALVADLEYDQTDVANLVHELQDDNILATVRNDIQRGQAKLTEIISAADGIQVGENQLRTHRHQSNVIFNLMRGGTPDHSYDICVNDFKRHIELCNRDVAENHRELLDNLTGSMIPRVELLQLIQGTKDLDLIRIATEYLPLTFARRHGDPTRPWNKFSIELVNEDGTRRLNYEGNWRDLFQNWEALGVSYPALFNGMVLRFLNASTADGYNPYRITKNGFDWEKPDPSDPWANIGYWGDHQIAYLQKLLEWSRQFYPDEFRDLLVSQNGVYADLPYRICGYQQMLRDPYNTIDYVAAVEQRIETRVSQTGSDGQLLGSRSGARHHVTVLEKLLVPALVKIANFVPDAGVWLNTQRPEWNDANNALVGNGTSVVTSCYLRRYFSFLKSVVVESGLSTLTLSEELMSLFDRVEQILGDQLAELKRGFSDQSRRAIVDELQTAGSEYRETLYQNGLSGEFVVADISRLAAFADLCLEYLDRTIRSNQRSDGLIHSYNLVNFSDSKLSIDHLYEMLEGQVALLGSQLLSAEESVDVLTALRNSRIYREDVNSYMLYPDRDLPEFVDKNHIDPAAAERSPLIQCLIESGDQRIVRRDVNGDLHFNGDFRNQGDVEIALKKLMDVRPDLAHQIGEETADLQELFHHTFQHRRFTGRSGTFFGYEGLGSVYWHMVSKLALAVQETYDRASTANVDPEILQQLKLCYREIKEGLGLNRLPGSYGAFPTDPYSHTPSHAGAQQPGMTGQVKEDVLSRLSEIGIRIRDGQIVFCPELFEPSEFLNASSSFPFVNSQGQPTEIPLLPGSFAFTFCQVPIEYRISERTEMRIFHVGEDQPRVRAGHQLTPDESRSIFDRDQTIEKIEFCFSPSR